MEPRETRRSFFKKSAVAGTAGAAMLANFGRGLQAAVNNTPQSSNPSALRITDLKCAYYMGHGAHLFVKIFTNQDVVGYGEGMDAVNGTYHLVNGMGRMLRGRNPLDVNRLFEDIRRRGFFGGAQSGIYVAVMTAIDHALWDLAGKALGLPIYRLLGGKFRDKIRIYCDTAHGSAEPSAMAAEAVKVKDMGFSAIKFDLDWSRDPHKLDAYNMTASPGEVERMVNQVAATREAIGPYVDLCLDMHGRYDLPSGIRVARALEPYTLMWLEEPIPAENLNSYREITESTSTPIATGENHYLANDFLKILENKSVDIIQPDLHKCGGVGEGQRIGNLANLYYVPVGNHCVASPLGAMSAVHCCASFPNHLCQEWHGIGWVDRWNSLIEEGPIIQDGYITVSDNPGVGVTLNEDAVKKNAVKDLPFFE